MNAIDISDLSLKIGTAEILKGVSLQVEAGTIHALIGHNGAGKTSLLRILLGLTPNYSGKLSYFESDQLNIQRRYIGSVMDSINPDRNISAASYLHKVCYMFGTNEKVYEQELIKKVGLTEVGRKPIGKFSLGMKRRLMIACALAGHPKLLILDEPFNGIDPKGMNEMRLLLQQLNREAVTILVTSHLIPELLKVATVFSVMHDGKVVDTFTGDQLSEKCSKKTILYPSDSVRFITEMEKHYPNIFCVPDVNGTVGVFGDIEDDVLNDIQQLGYCQETAEQKIMSEEDVLLWKMNGFQG